MMNFSIYKKMMLGFGAIISIMILSSGYILFELAAVANNAENVLAANVQTQEIARELIALIQDANGYIEKYQVSEDATYSALFFETSKQVGKNLDSLMGKRSPTADYSLVLTMKKAHALLVSCMTDYPKSKPDLEGIRLKNMEIISSCLDTLITKNQSYIGHKMAEIEAITARSVKVALLLIIGTLIAAVAAAILITRTITTPISDLIKGTEQIAKGNFDTIEICSRDEMALLANAVNDMSSKIDKTNQLRTQMMQQISHEIKTPLQAMQSAHDILKASNGVNEEQIHLLDTVKRSIDKITGFSKQYLDLAKIESGAMQYNMQWSDLSEIATPIVDEAKVVAASKHIQINLKTKKIPKIHVDQEKVSVIISNLITNAIKYTRENGKICVNVTPSDNGVQLEVQDSGIGIDKDEISNVFIRFYQARNIDKIKSNGSGVGLAIVRAYTEGHGGKVSVKSRPDEGSSFKIQFPISNDPQAKCPDHPLAS